MRQLPNAPVQKSSPETAQSILVNLARTALIDAERRADFPKSHLPRVTKPDDGAISRWQALYFLSNDFRTLAFKKRILRRAFRRSRVPVVEIRTVFIRSFSMPDDAGAGGAAANDIEHLSANAKLRITGERSTPLRLKTSRRLEQPYIACLDKVRHIDSAIVRKPRMKSARQNSNYSIHFSQYFGRQGLAGPGWDAYRDSRPCHDLTL